MPACNIPAPSSQPRKASKPARQVGYKLEPLPGKGTNKDVKVGSQLEEDSGPTSHSPEKIRSWSTIRMARAVIPRQEAVER